MVAALRLRALVQSLRSEHKAQTRPQVCSDGDVAFLKLLLETGLSPNACDYDGRSGQHIAAAMGRTQLLEILMDAGGHPSLKARLTPSQAAACWLPPPAPAQQ